MSLKHVQLFYESLLSDENFSTQIQSATNKEECNQMVKAAGYDFTQQELEEYTALALKIDSSEQKVRSLNPKELEAVAGGMLKFITPPRMAQKYGSVPPPLEFM
jgi:predicted ribosomally synthesized peptide with nif11-like leader